MNMLKCVLAGAGLASLLLHPILARAQAAQQPGFTTIHDFSGYKGGGDGREPASGLTPGTGAGGQVVLYGTTFKGGAYGRGTVYMLTAPASPGGVWLETILYSFSGKSDGSYPEGGLTLSPDGTLYGTTSIGGPGCGKMGCGTVFSLVPPAAAGGTWTLTTLYTFAGSGSSGGNPVASLLLGAQGSLFGVTLYGGSASCQVAGVRYSGCGVAFQLAPPGTGGGPWIQTVLHTFTGGTDGSLPTGIVFGPDGAIYGNVSWGGANPQCVFTSGCGTVFKLKQTQGGGTWEFTVVYSFSGQSGDGVNPGGAPVFDANGTLYGTTFSGGSGRQGTVFILQPGAAGAPWTETILYSFGPSFDLGANPDTGVVMGKGGSLYGSTLSGGPYTYGNVFRLQPPATGGGEWTITSLAFFNTVNGRTPNALAWGADGALYSTTGNGGSSSLGTAFQVQP